MSELLAAVGVGLGASLLVVGVLMRVQDRSMDLERILELPYGERDVAIEEQAARSNLSFLEPGVSFATRLLERAKVMSRLSDMLVQARVPLRPGEFALLTAGATVSVSLVVYLLTSQVIVAGIAVVLMPPGAWIWLTNKAERRRKAFEGQLPEALSLISSSLEAGHTFLHAVEMMVEESEAPMSEEFERVLAETRLGDPLIDALQRMSDRMQVEDLAWMVQAIRIQQAIGGKLGELLYTLADFMRAREEVRREVRVLTAEGRLSAVILGLLPVAVFALLQTINPEYIEPMLNRRSGLIAFGIATAMVLAGMAWIRKMARIDV